MLMVVLGAGASYDSVPFRPPNEFPKIESRPPLADQLFEDRPSFVSAMGHYPRCQPIVPYLQGRQGVQVERALEKLQAEADHYPERHRQLAAVRYYLHYMLWQCVVLWNREIARGVTNYKSLLDQVERWRKPREQVCLVTFNYDTLIEQALPTVGVKVQSLSDYIADDNYKLIKMHGSINWGRVLSPPVPKLVPNPYDPLIDHATDLNITTDYRIVPAFPIGKLGDLVLFPAIAIPVENKLDFECPRVHLETLRTFIPKVTKLLLIGWRATEVPFLTLLAENLKGEVRVMVVAGGTEEATEPITNLQSAGIKGDYRSAKGGFTEFIMSREGDPFLSG